MVLDSIPCEPLTKAHACMSPRELGIRRQPTRPTPVAKRLSRAKQTPSPTSNIHTYHHHPHTYPSTQTTNTPWPPASPPRSAAPPSPVPPSPTTAPLLSDVRSRPRNNGCRTPSSRRPFASLWEPLGERESYTCFVLSMHARVQWGKQAIRRGGCRRRTPVGGIGLACLSRKD